MTKRRNFYHRQAHHREDTCRHGRVIEKCDVCHEEQGELVEKVICTENVQRTAELALPVSLAPGPVVDAILGLLPGVTNVVVTPDYSGIQQEITVLKDEVIHFGYVPATIDVTGTIPGLPANISIPIRVYFQEHTDCPGVCPGDYVIESKPQVDAELNEPLINQEPGGASLNLLLFKAVIRSQLTVVRKGVERDGKICDLDPRRCYPNVRPETINSPLNLTTGINTGGNTTQPITPPNPPTP